VDYRGTLTYSSYLNGKIRSEDADLSRRARGGERQWAVGKKGKQNWVSCSAWRR
jgi:hypothetical protein